MFKFSLKKALILGIGLVIILLVTLSILNIRALWVTQKDIKELAYWSEVDMTMNEEVLQPFCELERDYLAWLVNPSPTKQKRIIEVLGELEKGLSEFSELVKDVPKLREANLKFQQTLKTIKKRNS